MILAAFDDFFCFSPFFVYVNSFSVVCGKSGGKSRSLNALGVAWSPKALVIVVNLCPNNMSFRDVWVLPKTHT